MKTKYIFAALLASAFMAQSCEDELDVEKKGNLGDPTTYYTTDQATLNALGAVYANMNRWWGYKLYDVMDNLSDDMYTGGGTSTDYNDKQLLNAYCFSSDNPEIKDLYTMLYLNIYDCNLILTYVTQNENKTDVMKEAISEAYFFRGISHFYLGALWGTPPIVTTLMQPSECTLPNSKSQLDVYEQAISDIQQAISYGGLPSKKSKNEEQYRVTKETAEAYLGKVQLFAGKYSDAVTSLAAVISSGLYDLVPKDEYKNLLNNRSDGSPEIMFCRYVDPTSTAPQNYDWSGPQNAAPYYEDHVMRGWRNDLWSWDQEGMGARVGDDIIEPGYGECNPRKSLYEDMKAWELKNGGDLSRLNQTMKTYEWFTTETKNKISAGKKLFGNEGYFFYKNRFLAEEIISWWGFGSWNVYINSKFRYMRYSEVLLLAAEAYYMNGKFGEATTELNKVRVRAGEKELADACTLDDIKQEKRFELCIEGCRFLDLVRWGDAASVLGNQGKEVPQFDGTSTDIGATHSGAGFVTGKHELLPFPATERLVNPNITQNPGW